MKLKKLIQILKLKLEENWEKDQNQIKKDYDCI